jgi:hypothetical protein
LPAVAVTVDIVRVFAGSVLVLAACSFRSTTSAGTDTGNDPTPTPPPDLALAYAFDEMTGAATVTDGSGNANTGSLFGAPVFAGGRHGNSMVFAGDDHVLVPNSASIDITGTGLTISGWVQLGNSPDILDDVIAGKLYRPIGDFHEPFYQYGVEYDDGDTDGSTSTSPTRPERDTARSGSPARASTCGCTSRGPTMAARSGVTSTASCDSPTPRRARSRRATRRS